MALGSTHWCGTLNNAEGKAWPDIVELFVEHPQARYICGQAERGENGTPHLQIYCQFKKTVRITALTNLFGGHWEKQRAKDNTDARDYCQKEDSRIWEGEPLHYCFEWGKFAATQGQRQDLIDFKDDLLFCPDIASMTELNPMITARYFSWAKALHTEIHRARRTDRDTGPYVIYSFGPAGTGKTADAVSNLAGQDPFMLCGGSRWNGYRGQDVILVDEWTPELLPLPELLQLLDLSGVGVNIKYGDAVVQPKVVWITSQFDLAYWLMSKPDLFGPDAWSRSTRLKALERRIMVELQYHAVDQRPTQTAQRPRLTKVDRNGMIPSGVKYDLSHALTH